jgi:hypothetical protein
LEFANSAANGLWVAIEKAGKVQQSAVSQFGDFRGGKETTVAFVQGLKNATHGGFHSRRINGQHGGILPKNLRICFLQITQVNGKTPCRKDENGKLINYVSLSTKVSKSFASTYHAKCYKVG